MAKSWGSTKGTTSSDKVEYMSFKSGKNVVRIVSPVLPRYVYWLKNPDGKPAAFDCLRFNRETERFMSGAKDPITTLGLKEEKPNDKGEVTALKPKKNYVCWVIDRADNKLKIMEVKATILKGIQSTMGQLEIDDPMSIDFVIERSGTGFNTEYKVQEIAASKFQAKVAVEGSDEWKLHQKDLEILGELSEDPETGDVEFEKVPSLDAQFPIPSYDEQLESIRSFLEGKKDEEGDQKDEKSEAKQEAAKEAASDLDD